MYICVYIYVYMCTYIYMVPEIAALGMRSSKPDAAPGDSRCQSPKP